ncbi:MAG TPA: hypothetical protein VMM79_12685 [Longimicrobiales bacterium]|nr:hypothetical protein [Longimicrobiales bacterium]
MLSDNAPDGVVSRVSAGPLAPGMPQTGRWTALIAVTATALLTLILCGLYWWVQGLRSYLPDEGIYTFVGWSWLQGDWPYRDTWDHKGPVVFAVTLIRTALLGSSPEMTGIQEIVMGLATASFLGAAAWSLWGVLAASMTAFASVLLWTQLGPTGGHMSTAGSIIALLNAACILLAVLAIRHTGRRRAWLVFGLGVAGGLGFLAKPNALGAFIAGALVLAWIERRSGPARLLRDWGLMAVGAAVPMALVAVVFGAAGALRELIEVAYAYNLQARGPLVLQEHGVIGMAARVVRGLDRLHVLIPTVVVMAAALLALTEQMRKPAGEAPFASAELIAPLWLGLELLVYASNGVYGHHIFPVLFSVALGMGWLVSIAVRLLPAGRRAWALAVILPMMFWPAGEMARLRPDPSAELPDWRLVGERIKRDTEPDERVLAMARMYGPSVLAIAERRTAVPYIHSPALYTAGYATNERWGELVSLLDGEGAPRFVVIPMGSLRETPADGPDVEWLVQSIDQIAAGDGPLAGSTAFPNRARTRSLLVQRYDVAYCEGIVCVLRLARPADPLIRS